MKKPAAQQRQDWIFSKEICDGEKSLNALFSKSADKNWFDSPLVK